MWVSVCIISIIIIIVLISRSHAGYIADQKMPSLAEGSGWTRASTFLDLARIGSSPYIVPYWVVIYSTPYDKMSKVRTEIDVSLTGEIVGPCCPQFWEVIEKEKEKSNHADSPNGKTL